MIKTQVLLRAHSMRKSQRSEHLHFGITDPEKKYTCQEGLLTVNWAPNHKQSPAVVANGGLSPTALHFREKPRTALPASFHCSPAVGAEPYKGVPGIMFLPTGGDLTCPVQSELQSYILFCIFTDQSEHLHNNK